MPLVGDEASPEVPSAAAPVETDDETDPGFLKIVDRVHQIGDLFGELGIAVALETGQETATALSHFLRVLEHDNVGVNFDPANMILYDKGDPIEALRYE